MGKVVWAMRWVTVLLVVSTGPAAIQAQVLTSRSTRPPALLDSSPVTIRVDASLVLIPVHVTNAYGKPVNNLPKASFRVSEDNIEQTIAYFDKDDAPISIGVLLDTSGSMRNKMRRSSEAAATFFKTANPQDEFFLIEFSDRPKLTVPFTNDPGKLHDRIVHTRAAGRTSLLDAVHLACVEMKNAHNSRRAILIISDGGDNRSRLTPRQVKIDVLESSMQTYAIGIFDDERTRRRTPEEDRGPGLLEDLAEESGGRHYRVDRLDELSLIAQLISDDLRNQYLLGYSSTNGERDGKYRRVRVSVNPPGETMLRTYFRRGYYAPVQ